MWYWDEWRIRAEKWWVRTIEWKVVPNTRSITMVFDKPVVAEYAKLKVDAENPKKENVEKLQRLLSQVKIYTWPIDWNFEKVKSNLIDFQLEKWVIHSRNSDQAWYFWTKTYVALRKTFWWGIFKDIDNKLDEDVVLSQDIRDKLEKVHNRITSVIDKKYWKNTVRAIKYRKDLRLAIDNQTKKIKSDLRKKQLKYLKSII